MQHVNTIDALTTVSGAPASSVWFKLATLALLVKTAVAAGVVGTLVATVTLLAFFHNVVATEWRIAVHETIALAVALVDNNVQYHGDVANTAR